MKLYAERQAWNHMRQRCCDSGTPGYENYGGRGISVCAKWTESFDVFMADMGPRPSTAHSIDRIDVNGNYQPDNCRWATRKEQQNNRRSNHHVVIDGQKLTLAQAAEKNGIRAELVYKRMSQLKWTALEAVTIPARRHVLVGLSKACKRGHAMDGDNVRLDSSGRRRCRACFRVAIRAWHKKRASK